MKHDELKINARICIVYKEMIDNKMIRWLKGKLDIQIGIIYEKSPRIWTKYYKLYEDVYIYIYYYSRRKRTIKCTR